MNKLEILLMLIYFELQMVRESVKADEHRDYLKMARIEKQLKHYEKLLESYD